MQQIIPAPNTSFATSGYCGNSGVSLFQGLPCAAEFLRPNANGTIPQASVQQALHAYDQQLDAISAYLGSEHRIPEEHIAIARNGGPAFEQFYANNIKAMLVRHNHACHSNLNAKVNLYSPQGISLEKDKENYGSSRRVGGNVAITQQGGNGGAGATSVTAHPPAVTRQQHAHGYNAGPTVISPSDDVPRDSDRSVATSRDSTFYAHAGKKAAFNTSVVSVQQSAGRASYFDTPPLFQGLPNH